MRSRSEIGLSERKIKSIKRAKKAKQKMAFALPLVAFPRPICMAGGGKLTKGLFTVGGTHKPEQL